MSSYNVTRSTMHSLTEGSISFFLQTKNPKLFNSVNIKNQNNWVIPKKRTKILKYFSSSVCEWVCEKAKLGGPPIKWKQVLEGN
jgi:hypothetical protein